MWLESNAYELDLRRLRQSAEQVFQVLLSLLGNGLQKLYSDMPEEGVPSLQDLGSSEGRASAAFVGQG